MAFPSSYYLLDWDSLPYQAGDVVYWKRKADQPPELATVLGSYRRRVLIAGLTGWSRQHKREFRRNYCAAVEDLEPSEFPPDLTVLPHGIRNYVSAMREVCTERQFQLFATAVCRCSESFQPAGAERSADLALEHRADSLINERQFDQRRVAAENVVSYGRIRQALRQVTSATDVMDAIRFSFWNRLQEIQMLRWFWDIFGNTPFRGVPRIDGQSLYQAPQDRDIFGNPYRLVDLRPYLTTDVRDLAMYIYGTRRFSAMPVLADALEDAGCHNHRVLVHCRGEKTHTRGCWVLDGLLTQRQRTAAAEGVGTRKYAY